MMQTLVACPLGPCAEDGDGDSASLDNALRLAWLWLGGVFLPCAGIVLYALGLQASP